MNRPRAREGLPQPQRRRAMLAVLAGLSMSVLDGAIANIVLPTIAQELRTDPATVVWVVNAYQLAVTISLLPFASLGELRGYRRVFVSGLAVFALGSLACTLLGSLTALVASRILQGFGGVGIMSVSTALLRFIYPADQLGRGIGINALAGSTSAAIGPSVAAGILSIASWQWLFAINVPLGVIALVLASAHCRDPARPSSFRLAQRPAECLDIWRADHRRRQSSPVVCQRRVRIGGCRGRGRALCLAAAHAGLPDAGARTLCATGLRALRDELDLLVHRAESDVRLAAVLPRGGARPIGGRDRPLNDPLAGGGRFCRADRGMARRPALSGRHSRRDRLGRIEPGTGAGGLSGSACGGVAHRLVHGNLRRRVRLLPIPEQPDHSRERAARTRRQRQWHPRQRAARRPDPWGRRWSV